ncbi:MAG: hypothetical protein EZS28_034095 [Streblomastix strix]|uniref:Uncharacterized protein n=1 Tax=Streblomastix strix TaxID=222440 RepID=A0A5J4UI41_9EUKA|nr:MAG: hypothetical protein EZS28_034095 [Streblomastix strix]
MGAGVFGGKAFVLDDIMMDCYLKLCYLKLYPSQRNDVTDEYSEGNILEQELKLIQRMICVIRRIERVDQYRVIVCDI